MSKLPLYCGHYGIVARLWVTTLIPTAALLFFKRNFTGTNAGSNPHQAKLNHLYQRGYFYVQMKFWKWMTTCSSFLTGDIRFLRSLKRRKNLPF
jgi:hypothetical protein